MNSFKVEGGVRLSGEVFPQGAKNEALQVICSVILTEKEVIIDNVPEILDVIRLIDLLEYIGVKVNKLRKSKYSFKADSIDLDKLQTNQFNEKARGLRGSIMIIGPMLSRFGKASIPKPGGDKIGRRRLDTHFESLIKLGAKFNYDRQNYIYNVDASNLKGNKILLDQPSVTGTANLIMASVLADGETVIYNAACEPYIQQLCLMINNMGGKISGIGSNLIKITGVNSLEGCNHKIEPDIIEIGSWIGLAALTQSEITIKGVNFDYLEQILNVFTKLGLSFEKNKNDLKIPAHKNGYEIQNYIDGSILTISDGPWPLFTPDLLSIVLVVATQARGSILIHQKMFESRLFFVDKLIDMGAQIILCDPHRATVIGLDRKASLRGIKMTSPDIRAGVSLLIAALSAEGKSTVLNIEQIDRGYENIEERLLNLGAQIKRID